MNAIRIRKRVEPETVRHLPELAPMLGKDVEIIALEEAPPPASEPSEDALTETPYDAFFALAGKIDLDWDAYKKLRALDVE